MRPVVVLATLLIALLLVVPALRADDVDRDIETLRTAGPHRPTARESAPGSSEAREARQRLSRAGVAVLPRLLVAMDTDDIVAANWLRAAYADIVEAELAKSEPQFTAEFLHEYVNDVERQGRTRRLVLELLNRLDPAFGAGWIPTRLADPEFRDDAVAAVLAAGETAQKRGETEAARDAYDTAFAHARSSSQVTEAARRLRSLGEDVSIVTHMGLVTDWYVLGPFDAPGKSGFGIAFPPETHVDLEAEYPGQSGPIRWTRHRTADDLGEVNLIQAIGPAAEAVGYAYSEIDSPSKQAVQLRCSADDNLSVWLNGEKIFGREQWLNGTRLDRFTASAPLKAGKNRVLVKACQGPQHVNPAVPNNWSMQVRFCTPDGAGATFESALPAEPEE